MKKLYFFVFSVLLHISGFAQGKVYYVSPKGNNANSGLSSNDAWQTISKVNSFNFEPGDQILFEGGSTFMGTLLLRSEDAGSAGNPVRVNSYGAGKAIIDAGGAGSGIYAHNAGWIEIKNLVVQTKNSTNIEHNGIDFFIDQTSSDIEHIVLDSLDVSGFQGRGIFLWTGETEKGFSNVRITNCVVHENGMAGIETMGNWDDNWQSSLFNHSNIYIGYCKAYLNYGVPTYTWNHSGSGIFVGGADGALIEYSEAYENGSKNGNPYAGPIGIWMAEIKNGIIQYCESHHNKGGVGPDGGGFDLDGGAQNCIIQYCYSHDNSGAGYALFEWGSANPFFNNIIRYNISQNDGRAKGYAGLAFWGLDNNHKVVNCEVYNNTIYTSTLGLINGIPSAVRFIGNNMEGVKIRNNIFYVTDGVKMLDAPSGFSTSQALFQNNTYYSTAKQAPFIFGSVTYSSFSSWMNAASGQEVNGGKVLGRTADPLFINPGGGGAVHPSEGGDLTSITAYRLQSGSHMIDAGLNLKAQGIDIGNRDFYNIPLAQAASYDIGANEFDAAFYSVLSLDFKEFRAQAKENALIVQWTIANNSKAKTFSVEVSSDGKKYSSVKTFLVKDTTAFLEFDESIYLNIPDQFYCKIKAIDESGRTYYSQTVKVRKESYNSVVKLYPNPVVSELSIQLPPEHANKAIAIRNSSGIMVYKKSIAAFTQTIPLQVQHLKSGVYFVEIIKESGDGKVLQFLKK